ncbi:MAG: hypothetical protein H7Y11_05360, partial [Armatimonadetes bacterium]|nr:hypothetical protein [Anaerolineae bacterium]
PASVNLNTSALQNFRWSRIYHTTPWQTPDGDYVQIPNPDPVRELMTAFYAPPTQNQVAVDVAQVRVFNGTVNADWDQVAVERLGWSGISAAAAGVAATTDSSATVLIDYTGESKGSSRGAIAEILGITADNIRIQPDPNRAADYDVILGAEYGSKSCTFGVLPTDG